MTSKKSSLIYKYFIDYDNLSLNLLNFFNEEGVEYKTNTNTYKSKKEIEEMVSFINLF
jgi:hypothetical protein